MEPWLTGCDGNLDFLLREGDGWTGIAYWAKDGKCNIGRDSPTIRVGGGRGATYHEMQHFEQYRFDDCYDDWKPGYDGNAEFIEGFADYGKSTVDNSGWYYNNSYYSGSSMYGNSYGNRFPIYLSEQVSAGLGPNGSPGDAWYRSNGMYEHYRECESQDDLYVEDTIVQTYPPYSYQEFFVNFLAANRANDWADEATQPELHYYEEDVGINFAAPYLHADIDLASGNQHWASQITPAAWAAKYYQVTPQSGCDYLTFHVDGDSGAVLGMNIIAADTTTPSIMRSSWIGEDFSRTFAAYGVHDRIVAVVNAFQYTYGYVVDATCVDPVLEILEPTQTSPAQVGNPMSPIAFLTRFQVSSGGSPVRGLVESAFTFDAEGDSISVVPGTLLEIGGGEYWATLLPPVKPGGTICVDFEVCLDGSICDSEIDGLYYVDPGNSDIIILHDESGSMAQEDVLGEGTRLVNAQKAATVWANLARDGDRYGVMGFNGENNPFMCGIPFGTGDCVLDINTHMARTNIINPSTQIPTIESAIYSTSALEWTPIGAGLVSAKDALLAPSPSSNPKSIILLSDGEENVNPLYSNAASGVQQEIIDSGVVVNTVGFSGDAPSALLSQIATDTGGLYQYVPTTPGTSMAMVGSLSAAESTALFMAQGVPQENAVALVQVMAPTSVYYPSNLGLADVYDYFEFEAQGATRISHGMHISTTDNLWKEQSLAVDESANILRLVSAGRQEDVEVSGACSGYYRKVELLMPDADERDWIPVSPKTAVTPVTWDIRNSAYVDVVMIPNPKPGLWRIRTKYFFLICPLDQPVPHRIQANEADFLMNASAQSTIRLEAQFLDPYDDGQGLAGEYVPVVAVLMQKNGLLSGASVYAQFDRPGSGFDIIQLFDDGNHGDCAADDGIYARIYPKATSGGTYNVSIAVSFPNPLNAAQYLARVWYSSFYVQGEDQVTDDDPFPPWWERDYPCMDPDVYNSNLDDYDADGLNNISEWLNGTDPCDPDNDDGGEMDGSEEQGGRDPLYAPDDTVLPILNWWVRPLNNAILVRWSHAPTDTRMLLNVEEFDPINIGRTGEYTLPLRNDMPFTLTLLGATSQGQGPPTEPEVVTPKADPDPPSGFIQINGGALQTTARAVVLSVNASDTLLDGLPSPGSAASIANVYTVNNEVSGEIEMRFSNNSGSGWSQWEPYISEKPWTLDPECKFNQICPVYAQFRDDMDNISMVVYDEILY